jgi:electron transport complex protein RnfD
MKLLVEATPHIRSGATTTGIMGNVCIALMPALFAATYIFGFRALILTAVCIASCMLCERIFELVTKRPNTIGDLSAVVTGMLLAFNLPVTLPYYMAVIGSFVAIVVVKQFFGGIGQNFANPAIVARIVLALSFTSHMNTFALPVKNFGKYVTDAVTSATPLAINAETGDIAAFKDLFFGFHGGVLGETCAAALLLGGLYLLALKIISPATPFAYLGTMAVLSLIVSGGDLRYTTFALLSGGLILGAFFMATDYATTPITTVGKVIFGVGCGLLTFVIRQYASMAEGVSFSILIMNIVTPYIDRLCAPKVFGVSKTHSSKSPKESPKVAKNEQSKELNK